MFADNVRNLFEYNEKSIKHAAELKKVTEKAAKDKAAKAGTTVKPASEVGKAEL